VAQQKHLLFRRGEIRAGSVGTEELADSKRDGAVGYFFADTGTINQLVHVWKFEDDNDRRAFRRRLFADKNFMEAPDAGAMGSSSLTRWLALLKDVAVAVWGVRGGCGMC
jgi:hypothetical protein